MADLEGVLRALKSRIVSVTENAGAPRTVIIGWPSRNQMKEFFQESSPDSRTIISLFTPPGTDKVITRYFPTPFELHPVAADLYVDVSGEKTITKRLTDDPGSTIQFELGSESASAKLVEGEVFAVFFDRGQVFVPDQLFTHVLSVEAGDSLQSIVQDLADQINAAAALANAADSSLGGIKGVIATVTGGTTLVLSLDRSAGSYRHDEFVTARVGSKPVWAIETKRQQRCFQVNIWAPSVEVRELFGGILDGYFGLFPDPLEPAGIYNRLLLPDGTEGLAFYSGSWLIDKEQTQKDWRRIFQLEIEYPTIQIVDATQVVDALIHQSVLLPPSDLPVDFVGGPLIQSSIDMNSVTQGALDQLEKISISKSPYEP